MAQATPAAEETPREDTTGSAERYVEVLAGLPGAEHVAVVDVSGQHVLGEWGGPEGSADALLERAHAAASRTGRRELEDVVSTTPAAFHLSRLVLAGPGHPESVWVGLRVNREQGSLAWSKAALAGLDGPLAPLATRIPTPREAPPGPEASPEPPAPTVVLAPAPLPSPPRAAGKVHVTLTARVATPVVVQEPAADPSEVATTVELRLPEPAAPEHQPEPPAAPGPRSSFAPVLTVAAPPSPVPDDGTTEEPAPMPAPVVYAPDPADEGPTPAAPSDSEEPRVTRKLIHGLRRKS
ncbi:hypothetical protein [Actinomycetospora termitidis]|uniref:Roadblock/LAMTOR2 domain-containing protein n=1 Tax=Actinomycetospora termitidis TaxID=3053470 RepID=A0ABT7MIW5_9PSEU|nr:hypothetical protein [Actinomycetospora sp. Odt1-22]MDL5160590.1 hypothetical protein [Actinomycetospora sp. Odt1-22]